MRRRRSALPGAAIMRSIGSGMYDMFEFKRRQASLKRLAKHILYRAVLVLQPDLRLVGIGMVGVYGVGVRVQLQQVGIRYHGPAEKQEQQQGDMSQERLHLL
jgi:hypothetical protein